MNSKVKIELDPNLFQRLQAIATPLVDSPETVIDKLLEHWERHPPAPQVRLGTSTWVSARGDRFPVGTKLRARYGGQDFEATITQSGIFFIEKTFNSPSAAAIAAKKKMGLKGGSANTNGWNFWEFWDETSQSWESLSRLRRQRV